MFSSYLRIASVRQPVGAVRTQNAGRNLQARPRSGGLAATAKRSGQLPCKRKRNHGKCFTSHGRILKRDLPLYFCSALKMPGMQCIQHACNASSSAGVGCLPMAANAKLPMQGNKNLHARAAAEIHRNATRTRTMPLTSTPVPTFIC